MTLHRTPHTNRESLRRGNGNLRRVARLYRSFRIDKMRSIGIETTSTRRSARSARVLPGLACSSSTASPERVEHAPERVDARPIARAPSLVCDPSLGPGSARVSTALRAGVLTRRKPGVRVPQRPRALRPQGSCGCVVGRPRSTALEGADTFALTRVGGPGRVGRVRTCPSRGWG